MRNIKIIYKNTIIIGSGAAGLNAADRLFSYGQKDIAIVTEGLTKGASRNTGSDKQTYYKLSLSGEEGDSVVSMAKTLYGGGAMDGDIALCEAALSAQCFYKLTEIGVPFPHNNYGEYAGYKTDHDDINTDINSVCRATSAGPLTSKYMTEKLLEQIKAKNIEIYDGYMAVKILVRDGVCCGALCLNLNSLEDIDNRYIIFRTENIIYATGGPAGLYSRSVYPESQLGASGIAFEAGVLGKNLTEWQYGIASVKFRWNLSGTYQQVLPAYISTNQDGENPREFLGEYFKTGEQILNAVFLKGYQWPFDPNKINNYGSSLIDMAVYNELENKKRRVFLDYRKNPEVLKSDFSNTGKECFDYLSKSNALFGSPAERLDYMNPNAVKLYKSNNIDLYNEPLEIAVCAQHNNGGLSGDMWWESNVRGFFPVGEVNGTHGIYRPGGSALNSGQCGSMRAAMLIAKKRSNGAAPVKLETETDLLKESLDFAGNIDKAAENSYNSDFSNVRRTRREIGDFMSRHAAHIRTAEDIEREIKTVKEKYLNYWDTLKLSNIGELPDPLSNRDLLIVQYVYLGAILNYIKRGGTSRGSYIIAQTDNNSDNNIIDLSEMIQEILLTKTDGDINTEITWRKRRPIPNAPRWFETVWNEYIKS